MSLRTRLVLALVTMGLLLLGPAIYSLQRLSHLTDIALELQGEHATASLALGRLRSALADVDLYERRYVASPDSAARQAVRHAVDRVREARAAIQRAGYGAAMQVITLGTDSIALAVFEIEGLVEAGQVGRATDAFRALRNRFEQQDTLLMALAAEIDRRSAGSAARAREISANTRLTVLTGVLGAMVAALALGAWTTGMVTDPIRRLRRAMNLVAQGKFETPTRLPYHRRDELGDLSRSFRSMTEQLAELERMRAEFMSVASHELKTPVHVISAYAQLIEDELSADPTDDRAEMLRAMQTQVKNLANMVNELLDLSRLEAGVVLLDIEDVTLDSILQAIEHAFSAVSRHEKVHFHVDRDATAPIRVRIDSDRIVQSVLGNLLNNAFKFTDVGGSVTLRVCGEPDQWCFEVSDTGRGIPADDLPHVFEKYYQLTKRDRKLGAGIGLAVARAVVRAHGGEIMVESEVGKGSTFRVSLPLAPDMATAGVGTR